MNWPDDRNGHGTHVASIVAAGQGNAIGISGVAPGVRVMPVQVLDSFGSGDDATVADGIVYAADNGARVINMSLGGTGGGAILHDAVRYAYGKGVTLIAAAGNEYGPPVLFPAAYDDVVLAVAASDHFDGPARFTSVGSSVDVAAPGENIYAAWRYVEFGGGTLRFIHTMASGTSMASPLVAGIAALVLSQDPSLGPAQVMDRLRYTAEDVNAAEHPGRDEWMGFGRVNAHRALSTPPRPVLAISSQSVNDAAGNANGRADPGEAVALTTTLANAWADATSVTATLTSAHPCVSVTAGSASFGPIAVGAAASNAASPFVLQVPAACPPGERISLALEVRTDGSSSVLSVPFTIGHPPVLFVSDDGGLGRLAYTEALDAVGIPYDVWDVHSTRTGRPPPSSPTTAW
jgi:subtilisin family serine protease